MQILALLSLEPNVSPLGPGLSFCHSVGGDGDLTSWGWGEGLMGQGRGNGWEKAGIRC